MNRYINVVFPRGAKTGSSEPVWQYDYGIYLRVQGLKLPVTVEIDFALQQTGGETISRVGTTQDGITDVPIPESLLENNNVTKDYSIYVWIFVSDAESGRTEYKITIPVKSRPRPKAGDKPEDQELFREAINIVNEGVERAESAGILARSWAIGGTNTRDGENSDNAKYYAKQAQDSVAEIPGAVSDGKKDIDLYIQSKKSELKGETGNVYFAGFAVKNGRLKMYSNPVADKVKFTRNGSRLTYQLYLG